MNHHHPRHPSKRSGQSVAARVAILASVGLFALLPGCYERVVSSKGMGASEAKGGYRSDTLLDRAYDDLTGANDKPSPSKTRVGPFRTR